MRYAADTVAHEEVVLIGAASSTPQDELVQFLAAESCDFEVVRALRTAGHDVTTAADLVGGADDTVVAGLAVSEARILLTEDKDFGQLAYATGHVQSGVILIRFPAGARRTVGAAVAHAVSRFGVRLVGSFVVVEPGRVRLGRPPRA